MTAELPPPGSYGLSRIGGLLGAFVAAAQAFTGDGSRYTHAFVVVSATEVVEAMPSGARVAPLADRLADPHVRFCDAPIQRAGARYRADITGLAHDVDRWVADFEHVYRGFVVEEAHRVVGVGYSFADYLALGLAHLGARPAWLRRYIARSGRLICSQLVDEVYRRSGIHLFDDGRLPMDVTPGDLDDHRVRYLEERTR